MTWHRRRPYGAFGTLRDGPPSTSPTGSWVETHPDFFCEGTWSAPFVEGDSDRSLAFMGGGTISVYTERWLKQIADAVEPKTHRSYSEILRMYLLPALGSLKVRARHRDHIKGLLAAKRAAGLSKNSVRLVRAVLSVMLGDAVDDGIIATNPTAGFRTRQRIREVIMGAGADASGE